MRDLRVEDHAPLYQASKTGPCICLYIYEPEWLAAAEFDSSHLVFVNQSLADLDERLRLLGGRLTLRVAGPHRCMPSKNGCDGIVTLFKSLKTNLR